MVFTDTVYSSEGSGNCVTGNTNAPEKDLHADASHSGSSSEQIAEGREDRICVFVCGAVNCEGVYELPADSRIIDAVEAAGGYSDDADRIYLNQAEYVYDTERIEIPTLQEAQTLREMHSEETKGSEGTGKGQQEEELININTADKQELMKIPGIGESKADRIIEYRELHGRFGSTEEVMNVSGIGSAVYEKMKESVTVK